MTWRNTPTGRRRALVAALTIALLAAACDGASVEGGRTAPATSPADALWAGPPEVRDVTEYTTGLGITVEEAQRRNGLVEAYLAGELSQWLDNRKLFHWVEETTDGWSVVVGRNKVNRKFAAKVEERVIGTPVEGLVEIRIVERDLSDFRRMETAIVESVGRWCLPPATSFEIDFAGNQLVMGVTSVGGFIEATDEAGISMPEGTVVVEEHRVEAAPSAATEPCEGPLNTLADARARWAAHGPDRYAYRASAWLYWLGSVDVEVRVWDGDVTEVITTELTPVDPRHTPLFGTRYGTVERLLDIVESHPVQWIGATYDANWGIPTSVSFNDPATSDEEWSFRIEDFRILESAPGPAPPRDRDSKDDLLAIERGLPRDIVVVDAVIQPTAGVAHGDWGWRHTLDVTSVIYSSPGANPLGLGLVEVLDRVGFQSPRALLHRDGDSARLMLTHDRAGDWRVFAVLESTLDGLQLHGPLVRRGYSEELAYLCHYPRDDIPTDPPPPRDAQAEFDRLRRWMDERGTFDPASDPDEVSREALRRVCGQE